MTSAPKEFADLFNRDGRAWLRRRQRYPQFDDASLETPYVALPGFIDRCGIEPVLTMESGDSVFPTLDRFEVL